MTWVRALTYVGLWAFLTVCYLVLDGAPPASVDGEDGAAQAQIGLLPDSVSITQFLLEAPAQALRCRRVGDAWEVVEPAGVRVPSDLIAAVIGALVDLHVVPVLRAEASPEAEEDFGLRRPRARLTLSDGSVGVTIELGMRNPAQTAVYARREGRAEVLLLGLNVQYYIDLLLEDLRRQTA